MDIPSPPFVSIVIPALNEADNISECLESIERLNYPINHYEIIVADNGSTDNTRQIANGFRCLVLSYPGVRIGELRNLGVKKSKGDVIAFVDADCIVPSEWLNSALSALADSRVGAVGGNCEYRKDANWLERSWALDKGVVKASVSSLATGSFILRRETFDKVKGFNEVLVAGEDTEISQRIIESGQILLLDSSCNVVHLGYPRTVDAFIKRQVWQTSDYLLSLKGGLDKTFLLTIFYLISVLFMFVSLITGYTVQAFYFFACSFMPPIAATIFRIYDSEERFSISLIITVLAVQTLYFVGRSIGLTISLYNKFKGKYG